jgi:predicted AAA+ superfamily ATPase
VLLETLAFHKLRAHITYSGRGGHLAYFRTPSGTEVDFVWRRGATTVGIEVKAAERWRPEYSRALNDLVDAGVVARAWGIYLGEKRFRTGKVEVLPLAELLAKLSAGQVLKPVARSAASRSRGP